jgi:hypothetical protein
LWKTVFGEPPVILADSSLLLAEIVKQLPVLTYSRISRFGVCPFDHEALPPAR